MCNGGLYVFLLTSSNTLMSEMSGKGKQVEVTSARSRLDATLQHLVERKDDSTTGEEIDVLSFQSEPPSSIRLNLSPKKPVPKLSRKRKRRADSSDNDNADEHTYIMKLFDRSVDMAQFPEDTPLYPVCRAWIQNRPHDKSLGSLAERPPSPDIKQRAEEEGNEHFIWEMPPPIKSEDGCLYDLRVPKPLPQNEGSLDIHSDPRHAIPTERLLLNHMVRWKQIRNSWHEASKLNEMQYASSIQLLKNVFESTNPMENI